MSYQVLALPAVKNSPAGHITVAVVRRGFLNVITVRLIVTPYSRAVELIDSVTAEPVLRSDIGPRIVCVVTTLGKP